MGALMGASGRTYFILEHKTSSKYHQAGESQKIIVDQVELGRDASCQVRFDESFETVSRKHAAIVRDGENWKLIHLSHSNPTLVNGHPINGSYYLQTGDEIQLSVGGPRLGFIVPQGRQALTSSIGLTERMSLFRKQALRPYKNALTIMGIVFVLAVARLAAWNYQLSVQPDLLAPKTAEPELPLEGYPKPIGFPADRQSSPEAPPPDV
jgi:FOG: FHA domain